MANTNAPFGFRPTMRTFTGGSGTIQATNKLVGYGTALFINDTRNPHRAVGSKPEHQLGMTMVPSEGDRL